MKLAIKNILYICLSTFFLLTFVFLKGTSKEDSSYCSSGSTCRFNSSSSKSCKEVCSTVTTSGVGKRNNNAIVTKMREREGAGRKTNQSFIIILKIGQQHNRHAVILIWFSYDHFTQWVDFQTLHRVWEAVEFVGKLQEKTDTIRHTIRWKEENNQLTTRIRYTSTPLIPLQPKRPPPLLDMRLTFS